MLTMQVEGVLEERIFAVTRLVKGDCESGFRTEPEQAFFVLDSIRGCMNGDGVSWFRLNYSNCFR